MPARNISLDAAKPDKLFYFVANVVIYRESDGRCLILKRSDREKAHPGKFAVPGGKLDWADLDINQPTRINGDVLDFENAVEKLLKRETMEEAGIETQDGLVYINSVAYIRPDGTPTVMVKFAAKFASGEVRLEKGAFTDFAWVNAEEVRSFPCILGIEEEVAQAIKSFSR